MSTRIDTAKHSTPPPENTGERRHDVRSRFSARKRVRTLVHGPTMTKQSHKDECDINQIMKKFENTGVLPEMIKKEPEYGDFSDPLDYHESMGVVAFANEQFAALSAKVRRRFGNDPREFLEFATDPRNGEEMVKMGLATKRAPEATEGPKNGNNRSQGAAEAADGGKNVHAGGAEGGAKRSPSAKRETDNS